MFPALLGETGSLTNCLARRFQIVSQIKIVSRDVFKSSLKYKMSRETFCEPIDGVIVRSVN